MNYETPGSWYYESFTPTDKPTDRLTVPLANAGNHGEMTEKYIKQLKNDYENWSYYRNNLNIPTSKVTPLHIKYNLPVSDYITMPEGGVRREKREEFCNCHSCKYSDYIYRIYGHPKQLKHDGGSPVDVHIKNNSEQKQQYSPRSAPRSTPRPAPAFSPRSSPGFAPRSAPGFSPGTAPGFSPRSAPGFSPRSAPGFARKSPPGFAPKTSPTFDPRSTPGFAPRSTPGFAPGAMPGFAQRSQDAAAPRPQNLPIQYLYHSFEETKKTKETLIYTHNDNCSSNAGMSKDCNCKTQSRDLVNSFKPKYKVSPENIDPSVKKNNSDDSSDYEYMNKDLPVIDYDTVLLHLASHKKPAPPWKLFYPPTPPIPRQPMHFIIPNPPLEPPPLPPIQEDMATDKSGLTSAGKKRVHFSSYTEVMIRTPSLVGSFETDPELVIFFTHFIVVISCDFFSKFQLEALVFLRP